MIIDKLNELNAIVNSGNIPEAERNAGMLDVCFIEKLPEAQGKDAFYPDPEYIVTPHSRKISWLLEQLNPAWYGMKDVETDRYGFFLPLLDAVKDALAQDPDSSAETLCHTILTTAEKAIAETITKSACKGVVNPDGLHLYFAYGSNMNVEQMDERCPGAITLGKAVLAGYKLVERKYADIDAAEGAETEGVLYAISASHLNTLDLREGYRIGIYDRKTVTVRIGDGACEAVVYEMTPETKRERNGTPYSVEYRERCSIGAQQHGVKDGFKIRQDDTAK